MTGDVDDYFVEILYQDVIVKFYTKFGDFESMVKSRAYTGDIVDACINGLPD